MRSLRIQGLRFLGGGHEKLSCNSTNVHGCLYVRCHLLLTAFYWKKLQPTKTLVPDDKTGDWKEKRQLFPTKEKLNSW